MEKKLIATLHLFALFGCLECLTVSIRTNPARPPYPAATWIQFACDVQNANGAVRYNWTLHCSGDSPSTVRGALNGRTDTGRFSVQLRSTPLSCGDMLICSAADSTEVATATWRNTMVVGVGFWGNRQPLLNNSAIQADAMGRINSIYCHSSTFNPNVGRWISPHGLDMTANRTDNFDIRFNNGPNYPSYNSLALLNPSTSTFSPADQGVYSCMMPDSTGTMQVLNIGIYPHLYQGVFNITAVRRVLPENMISLYCSTTGLPPTLSIWLRSNIAITPNVTYQITDGIINRQTSEYYSVLNINQTQEEGRGLYECRMINGLYEPATNTFTEVIVERHYIHVLPVGSVERLNCTIGGADMIRWEDAANDVVVDGQLIELTINDSIHEKVYYCRGYMMQGVIAELQVVAIALIPESSLILTAASDDGSPTLGQQYSIDCLAVMNVTGVLNRPVSEWVSLSAGNGVTINGPTNVGSSGSEIVVRISSLRTSHAGNYVCRGSVTSRALFSPLVKTMTFPLTVTIPSPMVNLAPIERGPYYASGSITLQCQASSSSLVDTPVSVTFTWRRRNSGVLTNGGRIAISTDTQGYRSNLTISGLTLSDPDSYTCEVIIRPTTPSQFIMPSSTVTSTAFTLSVIAVPITVSITPQTATVLDIRPYNAFSLSCIASTQINTVQPKVFTWMRRSSTSSSSTTLTHNGGSVVIATTGQTGLVGNSTLTTMETTSGTYLYTCSVTIGASSPSSGVSSVTVRGRSLPRPATNLVSIVTGYTGATIEWTIPFYAYTTESFTVLYGTSAGALTQSSNSVVGSTDLLATNQHYSVELTQLVGGTTYFYQIRSTNTIGSTQSSTSSFMIQQPPIITAITDTTSGGSPQAGSTFTLVCLATEQQTIVGTPTVTWMDPSGRSLSQGTTGDFTVTRTVTGSMVRLSLSFSPVRGSHSGVYSCRTELGSISFVDTQTYNLSVTVSSAIPVTITPSSTDYKAATPLQLMCAVDSRVGLNPVIGSVSYSWNSMCVGECLVQGQTSSTLSYPALRAIDSGVVTCTITDSVGNYGSTNFSFTVTGVGLYHSRSGYLANNSVINAPGGSLGSLTCISGRGDAGIGQWISPNGQDYTQPNPQIHPFQVLQGGATNPGLLNVTLQQPGVLPPEGVYSCIIPDENQATQIVYVGIHLARPVPVVSSLRPSNVGLYTQFTVNCTSKSSAATNVTWWKNGVQLGSGFLYDFSQILREGASSTYDNLLIVYQSNINELAGNYTCSVQNTFGTTSQTVSLNGIRVSEFGVFSLSDQISITCSSDLGVTSIQWIYNAQVIASSNGTSTSGSQVELRIDQVTDSLFNRQYTCRALSPFGTQQHTVSILVEVDISEDLSISVVPSSPTPVAGEPFSLTCTVTKAAGLLSTPSVEWLDTDGNVVLSSPFTGITVNDTVVSGNMVTRTLYFENLQSGYSGMFECTGFVTSTAPPFLLSKMFYWEVVEGEEFVPTTSAPPTEATDIPPGPCMQSFQLLLGPIDDCNGWKVDGTEEKINDIVDFLVQQVNNDCPTCSLTAQEITKPQFLCLEDFPTSVLFQATIIGDNIFNCDSSFSTLKNWIGGDDSPSVTVSSSPLSADPKCVLQVDDITSTPTCEEATPKPSVAGNITIIAIAVFAVLAVIVITIAASIGIICGIKMYRRGKLPVRGRRGSDVQQLTPAPTGAINNMFSGEDIEKSQEFNKEFEAFGNPLQEYEQESEKSVKIADNPHYRSVDYYSD